MEQHYCSNNLYHEMIIKVRFGGVVYIAVIFVCPAYIDPHSQDMNLVV